MRKVLFFVVAALVGFASCQKEEVVASGTFLDGGEYEIVFEELEGDGTKAAITEVFLDTKGDLAAKSQTLTATLRNKSTKATITGDIKYDWDVVCAAVEESVDSYDNAKNTLTAKTKGTGKVSVSATYKGQSVTSSDVPVMVTESEIESIKLLGSGQEVFNYCSHFHAVDGKMAPDYIHGTYVPENEYPIKPLSGEDGLSEVNLLCLYHSSLEDELSHEFTHRYSNDIAYISGLQPRLCLYVEVSFKGSDKKKKVNLSDGVEYTFLDKEGETYPNYEPIKETEGFAVSIYSHYDRYRIGFPNAEKTCNGYYSKYFGDHQVKASYKGFESTLDFNIAFDQWHFNELNKLCDINGWYYGFFGNRGNNCYEERPNGYAWYTDPNEAFSNNFDTWGITYRWSSSFFNYTTRYFVYEVLDNYGNHRTRVYDRVIKSCSVAEEDEHWCYVETYQQNLGDREHSGNRFDVWFLNKCIFSVFCGLSYLDHLSLAGVWDNSPEYF